MRTIMLQTAIFFGGIIDRPDLEIEQLNKAMGSIFNTVPTVLPIPNEVQDIPVVQLRSSNNKYNLNISRARADFILSLGDDIDTSENIRKYSNFVKKFIEYFLTSVQIKRIGMVSRNFLETDNPVLVIASKYLKDVVKDTNELNLRFNKRKKFGDQFINDIVEVNTAFIQKGGIISPGVMIQRDINNAIETSRLLSRKELLDFHELYFDTLLSDKVKELI